MMVRVVMIFKPGVDAGISPDGRVSVQGKGDAASLTALIRKHGVLSIYPLFDTAIGDTPEALDLMRFFGIDMKDSPSAERMVRDLLAHPLVENAYVEPPAMPALPPED